METNNTTQILTYGGESVHYQVLEVPGRTGKVAIHVYPDGSVQVDAPTDSKMEEIKGAVQKRARWVMRHVDHALKQREHVLPREYVSGESHFYLGRRYQLKIVLLEAGKESVKLSRGLIRVETNSIELGQVKKLLLRWYRSRAADYFTNSLGAIIQRIAWVGEIPEWRLLIMKRQWGSCSPQGVIFLNPHLVKAPRECIEYVLIHELCHLSEHNHSLEFYRLLEAQMPGWRSAKAKLDGMAELILNE